MTFPFEIVLFPEQFNFNGVAVALVAKKGDQQIAFACRKTATGLLDVDDIRYNFPHLMKAFDVEEELKQAEAELERLISK